MAAGERQGWDPLLPETEQMGIEEGIIVVRVEFQNRERNTFQNGNYLPPARR